MNKITSLLFEVQEWDTETPSKHFLRPDEKWWPILISHTCDDDYILYCLLMNDHKVDEPHVIYIKSKNPTELVQGILRFCRIYAFIYSVCEKVFFCSPVNEFV